MHKSLIFLIFFIGFMNLTHAQGKDTVGYFITAPRASKDSLYSFIGRKISVNELKPTDTGYHTDPKTGKVYSNIYFDAMYSAKYIIIKNVFNKYDKDTIDFVVFDHYGPPPFTEYNNSLLFVKKTGGKFYHIKYLYFNIYQTDDGRWASPCYLGCTAFPNDYKCLKNKAVPLKFKNPVVFNITQKNTNYFSAPYFKIEGKKAIALMGTYTDDLFKIAADNDLKPDGFSIK